MKVLLLYPTWTGAYGLFGHFARRNSTWPPLNLALLAAIAEQHGHDVTILDGEAERIPLDEMVKQAIAQKPDLIGFTATSPFFHISRSVAEGIKRVAPHIPIAVGGPHITIMKEKALLSGFDYAFIGEAEESWPRFLDRYEQGGDISSIAGIIYRRDGEIVSTGQPDDITALISCLSGQTSSAHAALQAGHVTGSVAVYLHSNHAGLPVEMYFLCLGSLEDNQYAGAIAVLGRQ